MMPLPTPDLWHARLEQKAVQRRMKPVKNARLANPAPKEPPNAKRAAKESSMAKRAPPAKSAHPAPFKIKTHCQVPFAKHVQPDTTTT